MNNQELKESLLQHAPVSFRGVGYARVSAIIYRAVNGQISVSAELMDKSGKSVTIADPKFITKEVDV